MITLFLRLVSSCQPYERIPYLRSESVRRMSHPLSFWGVGGDLFFLTFRPLSLLFQFIALAGLITHTLKKYLCVL